MSTRTNTKTGRDWGKQDFLTLTEVDTAGVVGITSDVITLTAGDRDEDYYATKDFGTGFFGDFTHWMDVNVTVLTNDAESRIFPWGISNTVEDFKVTDDAGRACLIMEASRDTATTYQIVFYDIPAVGATDVVGSPITGISVATGVYISVARASTTLSVDVYSTDALRRAGSAGDGDVGAESETGAATTFQYLYGIGSYNTGDTAKDLSGTVSNLVLIK